MKKVKGIGKVLGLLFIAIIFIVAINGQANAQLTYDFGDNSMFGAPQYGGVAPTGTWATATFIDVGVDHVQLTLNVTNNLTVENISAFYFNYEGDATALTINAQAGGGSTASVQQGNNSYMADGDGLYDLLFDFPPPPGNFSAKFTAGETVIYDITGTGVSAANFYTLAAPSQSQVGPFYAAAKLGGIPCDQYDANCISMGGTTSAWAAGIVPEPVSSALFIVGAATLGFRRFRKKFRA
jgi:hypothetical protein